MKHNIVKKKRRAWRILLFLSLIALLVFLSTGKRGFIQQFRVKQKQKQLKKEIAELQNIKEMMDEEEKKLDEPETIEKIAREKYGMAKKNEKVYRVVPKEKK
jgi:cell division protein FtsB